MNKFRLLYIFPLISSIAVIAPLNAGETTTYTYDALGRLVKTTQTGSVNNGIVTDIEYDEAGNRKDYKVTGSNGSGEGGGVTGIEVDGGGSGGGSGSGGGDGGDSGSGTPPETPPSFLISDATAVEGAGLTFTITKQGSVSESYSVNYATANGSALAGSDYGAQSGTLTFSGSQGSKTITISSVNDSAFEQTEVFYLDLSSPSGGASIADPQGAGTISDNDSANSPPIAASDYVQAICNGPTSYTSYNVLANDSDPDNGDSITVVSTNVPGATIGGGSTINFPANTPTSQFSYVINDSQGASDTGAIQFVKNCGGNFPQF